MLPILNHCGMARVSHDESQICWSRSRLESDALPWTSSDPSACGVDFTISANRLAVSATVSPPLPLSGTACGSGLLHGFPPGDCLAGFCLAAWIDVLLAGKVDVPCRAHLLGGVDRDSDGMTFVHALRLQVRDNPLDVRRKAALIVNPVL